MTHMREVPMPESDLEHTFDVYLATNNNLWLRLLAP